MVKQTTISIGWKEPTMLTDKQEITLRAAIDRIIPPDDTCVGGTEAGALDYVIRQLSHGGDLHALADDYAAGLDALEQLARTERGIAFADLSPDAQDTVLIAFEQAAPRFFRLLVEHAQEGFYTSPAAWEMIGWKVRG